MVRALYRMAIVAAMTALAGFADAQPLGTYSWQLAPYCNIVTVNVTQTGSTYTLDGYDTQCGGATRASVTGMAFPNPNGTIGLGLSIVTTPNGIPVHVETTISLTTLGGLWHDNLGNTGSFIYTPSALGSGNPRPVASGGIPDASITTAKLAPNAVDASKIANGTIGAQHIDPAQVQQRIQSACSAGQLMTGVNQNGTVVCESVASGAGGDITSVTAATGLVGGGTAGDVALSVAFEGSGTTVAAARSDHTHAVDGLGNTRIGESALVNRLPSSSFNTALGRRALTATTSGNANTAVGFETLEANVVGHLNTAVGDSALNSLNVGSENAALGASALTKVTLGSFNSAVGSGALDALGAGASNVAIGAAALGSLTAGDGNTVVGGSAGLSLTSGSNNLYLDNSGTVIEDNTIRVGSGQTRAFLMGVRGATTGMNNAVAVVIDSLGQLGTVSSSRHTKFDIADLQTPVTSALQQLRPVQFRYRQAFADGSTPIQYGLIAEEVQDVLPELVALNDAGQPVTVKYHVLPALLVADLQRLERERVAQNAVVRAQGQQIDALREELAGMRALMEHAARAGRLR